MYSFSVQKVRGLGYDKSCTMHLGVLSRCLCITLCQHWVDIFACLFST